MGYKWKFFEERLYNAFVLAAIFLTKQDFFSDMLLTGLATLHSTYRCIDKSLTNETRDRKAVLILAEAGIYAGYEIVASKNYISAPPLEVGLKVLAAATPMIVTAYKHYRPQNQAVIIAPVIPNTTSQVLHNEATISLEVPERPEVDIHESIDHNIVRLLP
jgi:hypothetical protein